MCVLTRLVLLAALALLGVVPAASAAVGASTSFSTGMPTGGAPREIVTGADGNLWFTLPGANAIGRITPTGTITTYTTGITAGAEPWGIAAGPDGNLWFTERAGNAIGRITPEGAVTEYALPTAGSAPWGIVAGADGALWYTLSGVSSPNVGRITTAGQITQYDYAAAGSEQALGIASGPSGGLWIADRDANAIIQLDQQGALVAAHTAGITAGAGLVGIAAGPDGALWFTEETGNRIGRITTAGAVTEYAIAASSMAPIGIAAGPDGALWASEYGSGGTGANILRITTAGAMAQYGTTAGAGPVGIAAGPDGNVWYAESTANRIGRMLAGVVPTNTTPPQIVGSPVVGTSLSATLGSWTGSPVSYRYRWLRCTTAAATKCSTVRGRTRSTYLLGRADQGRFIKVSVVATNLNGASRPQGSPTTAQIPSSAFTTTRRRVRVRARDVLIFTTITAEQAGRVTQIGTTRSGSRTVRRCRTTRRMAAGQTVVIRCRLLYRSRVLLRRMPLYLTLSTTYRATNGAAVTKRQRFWLRKRPYPFRRAR